LLAGANRNFQERREETTDSGILTAYDASGLDLVGTDLVVLSACDTGLGDIATGGEVFGLRRSFQIAGAKWMLMSMWPVPDKETAKLMEYFYDEWMETKDMHVALRNAQLRVRNATDKQSTYLWAGFVLYGP
jgi:CHAT domain-containing protein